MKPVARATLQAALGSALAKTLPEQVYLQLDAHALEEALTAAGADAVDSVRAEPVGDRAIAVMERLHAGLAERGVADGGDVAERALSTIDAFQTALDEAAQGELELISDGLTAEQEIRARALDVAGRKFGSFGYDTAELLACAETLAGYIRDGAEPDDRAEMLEELAPLFAVYAGWQNSGAAEPTEEQIAAGYISLLPADDAHAIDAACDAVEPLLPRIRRRLGIDPLVRGSAEERSDDPSNASDLDSVEETTQ